MPGALTATAGPTKVGGRGPTYDVSDLLTIGSAVAYDKVPLEKFCVDEVVKEHVIRPAAAGNLAPMSAIKKLEKHVASKRPSPSPSIKRGKAEKLIKEHGSPPGVRVTAASRIVPTSTIGLTSSSGVAASLASDIVSSIALPQATLVEGYVCYNSQGQLSQYHNGALTALEYDSWGMPKYFQIPINHFPIAPLVFQRPQEEAPQSSQFVVRGDTVWMPIKTRMELVHKEMDETRKTLVHIERQNVFANYKPPEKMVFVARKKELILRIDSFRKELTKLQEMQATGIRTVGVPVEATSTSPVSKPVGNDAVAALDAVGISYARVSSRESRAVPIIAPKSSLNPASPEFQPPKPVQEVSSEQVQARGISGLPGSGSENPKEAEKSEASKDLSCKSNHPSKKANQKSSSSSYDTVDFFPFAPEEHSLSRDNMSPQNQQSPQKHHASEVIGSEFNRSELSREEQRGYDAAIGGERYEQGRNRAWRDGYTKGCYNMFVRYRFQYHVLERTYHDMQSILAGMHPRDAPVKTTHHHSMGSHRTGSHGSSGHVQAQARSSAPNLVVPTVISNVTPIAPNLPPPIPLATQYITQLPASTPTTGPAPTSPGGSGSGAKDFLKNLASSSTARAIYSFSTQNRNATAQAESPGSGNPSPVRSPSRLGRLHFHRSQSSAASNDRQWPPQDFGAPSPGGQQMLGIGGRLFRRGH